MMRGRGRGRGEGKAATHKRSGDMYLGNVLLGNDKGQNFPFILWLGVKKSYGGNYQKYDLVHKRTFFVLFYYFVLFPLSIKKKFVFGRLSNCTCHLQSTQYSTNRACNCRRTNYHWELVTLRILI